MKTVNNLATFETAFDIDRLLRLPQVLELIPVSRSHWWAGVASGKYPKGIKLSERCTVWRASHLRKLIQSI
jgi:predicted DNA-binding transcriptional regulator AlpA